MTRVDCRIGAYNIELAKQVPLADPGKKKPLKYGIPKCPGKELTLEMPEFLVTGVSELVSRGVFNSMGEAIMAAGTIKMPKIYPPIPGPMHEYTVLSMHTSPDTLINKLIHLCIYFEVHLGKKRRIAIEVDQKYLKDDPIKCRSYHKHICKSIYEAMK